MLNVSSYGEKGSWRKKYFSGTKLLAMYLCSINSPVEQSPHLILSTYQAASKKWTDSKAALTTCQVICQRLYQSSVSGLKQGLVVECLPHMPKALEFMPRHHQNKKKKEILFHQQDKQLQDKMIGCQGSGYKRTDPQIRLKSLCDAEEKHLKVQVGHLGAFSCIYLGHRRIREDSIEYHDRSLDLVLILPFYM